MPGFLDQIACRTVTLPAYPGLESIGLFLGHGTLGFEVLAFTVSVLPSPTLLKRVWNDRNGARAAPLVVVALAGDRARLCGPDGRDPPVFASVEREQAERLCGQALLQPDRNASLRFLHAALPTLEQDLPGVRNEGLLSLHVLVHGAQKRPDWALAGLHAARVLGQRDGVLLSALGFTTEPIDSVASLLRAHGQHRAVAILLDRTEAPEIASARFQNLSPVSHALHLATQRGLPWVVLVQDDRVRLYPARIGVGVGRRGSTDTWIELQTSLLRAADAPLLWLLFSAGALGPDGTLDALLEDSRDFAGLLAKRLRERIYDIVVPALATGIVQARRVAAFTPEELQLTYEMALTVLFRLLFIAYAEDRGLLPYRTVEAYRRRALKTQARELLGQKPATDGVNLWQDAVQLFDAVRLSRPEWGVPAYGGGLFETHSRAGRELEGIVLANTVFEPALRALLLIVGDDGLLGPVDFRSLGVREFGTIYEGLLESELAVAGQDLAIRPQGKEVVYVPAGPKMAVTVRAGEVYLHDRSGARKSSGSYFTPAFAVEHLLDAALEPALEDHAARLAALGDADAAEAFFDIRVADIAMGSGHFLVAAVDRIERRLSAAVATRPGGLPGVRRELDALRTAAYVELRRVGLPEVVIEDGPLLRRLIARRCIYGVDLNPLSVQLAKLSIWIHSFVPGLPLSLLDHSLVQGSALVGIATIGQLRDRFDRAGHGLFPVDADNLLGSAAEPLDRLARLADATLRDVQAGRNAMEEAQLAVAPRRRCATW